MIVNGYEIEPYADLSWADLRGADLREANLRGANLREAEHVPAVTAAQTSILPEGDITGWKKCRDKVIVKLLIPSDAKRSNGTGRKCRAEYAEVVEIYGAEVAYSHHNPDFAYRAGETVWPQYGFDEDRWNECASGIHFYITREEAEAHMYI